MYQFLGPTTLGQTDSALEDDEHEGDVQDCDDGGEWELGYSKETDESEEPDTRDGNRRSNAELTSDKPQISSVQNAR